MGIPHDEVQVLVLTGLLTNQGVEPQPPSSHTSALAARSHPRISTTSAAVIVIRIRLPVSLCGGLLTLERWRASSRQHAYEHGSKYPILFAVDQELGEGATLRVAPELADSVGPLEVGEHQDVEQLGARGKG
jgi:hypothetical protein